MKCTCVIDGDRIVSLCDIHSKASTVTYNRAIESAAKTVMFAWRAMLSEAKLTLKKVREITSPQTQKRS